MDNDNGAPEAAGDGKDTVTGARVNPDVGKVESGGGDGGSGVDRSKAGEAAMEVDTGGDDDKAASKSVSGLDAMARDMDLDDNIVLGSNDDDHTFVSSVLM